MTRVSLPVLGSIFLASVFAAQTRADEKPALLNSDDDRILVTKQAYDISDVNKWDVVVFNYPSDGDRNYIKRLIGIPGETLDLEDGELRQATEAFDTIKTQGAKIEITRDTIRIEGGNVEIRRTVSPK